jgi:radical SAM protein with 4Fe4S-binding SPASM domain
MLRVSDFVLEHIDIEVNHRCNMACRHCSARAAKGRAPEELSVGEIKGILTDAKELGLRKVGLTGGEPLVDISKLEAIARFCIDELGVPLHTHVNGTLVTEEMCQPGGVLRLFEAVSVTFLGGDGETHDYMTKVKGSFEKALRGAAIIAKAGLPLTCYYIPTHGTCGGFKELTPKLREIGVKRIRAMALAPSGRARPIYGQTAPGDDEMRQFEKDLLEGGEQWGIHMEAGYCTRLSMRRLKILNGHERCMSGINRVHINSKGDVFPCTAASGVKELRLGNLKSNGAKLADIWFDSDIINLIREIHNGGIPACAECSRKRNCRGGCTVNACGTMSEEDRMACPLTNSRLRKLSLACHGR